MRGILPLTTMGGSLLNWRTLSATALAVVLIGGSYLLARGVSTPPSAEASTESALLQAIASKDSDNDGLPDWEESLYGTNPDNPDSFNLGMTDGQAVAKGLIVPKAIANVPLATSTASSIVPGAPAPAGSGTLTDEFAKSFFTLYLVAKQQNNGVALSQDQVSALADKAYTSLAANVTPAPDFKKASDLSTVLDSPDAYRTFAASAEAVFAAHTVHLPKSELIYLQDAVQNDDASAIGNIQKISGAYRDIATGLAALPVPSGLAGADLSLVNAMARISQAASDFAAVRTDPVATMFALETYPQTVIDFANGFQTIGQTYASQNISIPAGSPGAQFVGFYASLPAATATSSSP